jgi:capsular polysaccharide biosynthesis protein
VQEINPRQLLQYYAKKWIFIIVFTVLGLVAGAMYTFFFQTPLYKSDTTVMLVNVENPLAGPQDATLINNYAELLESRKVLEPVITKLGLGISYEQIVSQVTAAKEKDTDFIKVSVSTESPQTSMKIAEEVITSFKREVRRLYGTDNVEVIDQANRPAVPYNIHAALQISLAAVAGLALALIVLFLAYDLSSGKAEKVANKKPKSARKKAPDVATTSVHTSLAGSVKDKTRPAHADVVSMLIGTKVKTQSKKDTPSKE